MQFGGFRVKFSKFSNRKWLERSTTRSLMLNSFVAILKLLLKTIPVQYNGRSLRPGHQNQLSREKWSVFQRLTGLTRLIY